MRLIFFPDAEEIISNYLLHFSYKYLHASVSRYLLTQYYVHFKYRETVGRGDLHFAQENYSNWAI